MAVAKHIFKPYLFGKQMYSGGKPKTAFENKNRKIYKLSSNENPIGASPKAIEAIRNNLDALHEYPDQTDARVVKRLVDFYENALDSTQLIVTPSGSEVLELTIRAFLGKDLECIVSSPCFSPYIMFASKMAAKVIDVPLKGDNFVFDLDGILAAITENTRLIFITSPNNPTGTYIPKMQLDRFFQSLPDHVVVVFDEVYFHFAEAKEYCRALPYVLQGRNVIAINSFSKTYGLAGLRVGYAYGSSEIIQYIRLLLKPFLLNTLSIAASIAALNDNDFLVKTQQLVWKERKYISNQFDKWQVNYTPSQGNFILIKPKMTPANFEKKMLEHGIMVRQVGNFGAPKHIRISIGNRAANKAMLNALVKIRNEF